MPKLSLTFALPFSAVLAAAGFSGCGPTDEEDPMTMSVPTGPSATTSVPSAPTAMPTPPAMATPPAMPPPAPTPTPTAPEPEAPVGDPIRSTDGPSYATTVEPIIVSKCATSGCHVDGGVLGGSADISTPPVNMVLAMGEGYAVLTDGPSVELPAMWTVGHGLDDSYLWHKLNNTFMAEGGVGAAMPIGFVLTADELAAIQAWIEGGASP
jgi:hypothetical protein